MATILNTAITFIVGNILGWCLSAVKKYKNQKDKILEEFKELKESQMMDMKTDLSNKFFVYDAMENVEDYLVMAFREKCERYFKIGGDTWIHPMYERSFKWKIKRTGYLE